MKKSVKFGNVFILSVLLLFSILMAKKIKQPTIDWMAIYDGPAGGNDWHPDMAVFKNGDVFISGCTDDSEGNRGDYCKGGESIR